MLLPVTAVGVVLLSVLVDLLVDWWGPPYWKASPHFSLRGQDCALRMWQIKMG